MIMNSILFLYLLFTKHCSDNVIVKFADSFNNDSNIDKWKFFRYTKRKKCKNAKIILKRVINPIKEVLIEIETDEYKDFKRFILKTQLQSFNDISFFYFETFLAVRSIKRILTIKKNYKSLKDIYTLTDLHKNMINLPKKNLKYPTHHNSEYFWDKVILFEYACIYNDIVDIIKIIFKRYINTYIVHPFIIKYHLGNCFPFKIFLAENIKYFIEYAGNTIHRILNIDRKEPICIITSPNGITHSVKCSQEFTKIYRFYEYKIIDTDEEKRELDYKDTKCDGIKQSNINYILDKPLVYNRSSMELFIILIHYHSVMNNMEYKYEFNLTYNKLYEVKCSKYNIKKVFKSYYLNKDIPNNCISIHKFSLILDYNIEYTTIKPNNSKIEPIKTRVIKLCCGHLLGLELIDEWFCMFPNLKCHICMVDVVILGSFDTVVYKCSSN